MVLEPNNLYSQVVPMSFKITMASLGPDSYVEEEEQEEKEETKTNSNWNTTSTLKKKPSTATATRSMVMLTHEGQSELSLCSLVPHSLDQQPLDIAFSVGEEIKLRCIGSKAIHLTGYFINDEDDTNYCNGYDSEELEAERDGESIASTSSSEEEESNDDSEFDSSEEDEEFCHGHSSDDSFIVDDDVEEYITSSSSSDERDSEFSSSASDDDEEDLDTEEEEELFRELNKRYSKRKNNINNNVILSDSDDMSDEVDSDEFSSGDQDDESLTTCSSEEDDDEESLCDSDIEIDSLSDVSFESADYDNDLEAASCCTTSSSSSSSEDIDNAFESEDEYTSSESDITSSTDSEEEDSDVDFNTSEEEAFAAELYKRVKKLQKRKHVESSSSEEEEEEEILSDEAFAEGETQDSIMKKVKNDDVKEDGKEEQVIPEVVPIAVAVADDANVVEVGASAKEELPPVITPAPTPVNSPKKTMTNSSALEYKVLEGSSKKSGIKSQKGRQVTLHSQANGGAEVQTVLQSDSPFAKALLGMGVGEKRMIVLSEECISSPCALLKEFKNGDAKDITVCLTDCQNVGKNISVSVSLPKKAKKE